MPIEATYLMTKPFADCGTYFHNLGSLVNRIWREANRDEAAFPDIAAKALEEDPPANKVSIGDAVKFGLFSDNLPIQEDIAASFGQPPLTVYWSYDFRIELLFWNEGVPGIHQHAFSGAFHVMHGSSLHSIWNFTPEARHASRLFTGKVSLSCAELLHIGETRPIVPGAEFIHATYHLDRPSITVVVRTNREEFHLPQYVYLPPSVCFDARHSAPIKRRLQLLQMLKRAALLSELFEGYLHLFETTDAYAAFHYLLEAYKDFSDQSDRNRLLVVFRRRWPQLADAFEQVYQALERRDRIVKLRQRVTNSDLQFFLALQLNIPDRSAILDLVRQRYSGGDPLARVYSWIEDLRQLGVFVFNPNEITSWLLPQLLRQTPLRVIQNLLIDKCGYAVDESFRQDIADLADAIRSNWLLAPLFSCEPLPESKAP